MFSLTFCKLYKHFVHTFGYMILHNLKFIKVGMCVLLWVHMNRKISKNFKVNASEKGNWGEGQWSGV